ncbi:MAG: hypothetical protein ABSC06_24940 [Rhodopila sp.]|jgi:P-type conjugative transfer protein TrbJ
MLRRSFLTSAAALPLLPATRAWADIPVVDLGEIGEEIKSVAQEAESYARQGLQYATELQQYANMVQNTVALPLQFYSQVMGDINQVRALANAASVLTGNSGTILQRLQSAGAYANQAAALPQNIGNQFTQWQQTLGNASSSLGRTLGLQQGQLSNYATQQAAIQLQSQSALGQMQAIQAGNELAALTAAQMNQLQTTMTAIGQQIATRDMIAADRQGMQDAQFEQFIAAPYPSPSGGPRY